GEISVTFDPGPADYLALLEEPSSTAQSGVAFAQQPVVQLRDAKGNAVAESGIEISAVISTGAGGSLIGTTRVATDASGKAAFTNLGISGPVGNYAIEFQADESEELNPVTSQTITLGVGEPDAA